jgi:hypothetical protein
MFYTGPGLSLNFHLTPVIFAKQLYFGLGSTMCASSTQEEFSPPGSRESTRDLTTTTAHVVNHSARGQAMWLRARWKAMGFGGHRRGDAGGGEVCGYWKGCEE